MSQKKAPPPPKKLLLRKASQLKTVRALFSYKAQAADELSFEEGDLLFILDDSNPNWWKATTKGKQGLVPFNYFEDGTEEVEAPLHESCKRGNLDMLQECLKHGVSVNSLDRAKNTPLHWAARGGHASCVGCLLQQPDILLDYQNNMGDTPLHSGSWKGSGDVVKMLLQSGADVSIRNNDKKLAIDLSRDPEASAAFHNHRNDATINEDCDDSDN